MRGRERPGPSENQATSVRGSFGLPVCVASSRATAGKERRATEAFSTPFNALRINSPFLSPFLTPVDVTWEVGLQYRIGSFLDRKENRIFHQNIRIYNG